MRRGTTPKHTFKSKIDLRDAEVLYITYKQKGKTIIERTKDQMEVLEDRLVIHLTQQETLAFSTIGEVEIQCRARFPDTDAIASNIIVRPALRILKEGVI